MLSEYRNRNSVIAYFSLMSSIWFRGMPRMAANNWMCSLSVISFQSESCWGQYPISRNTCESKALTLWPLIITDPLVCFSSQIMILIVVVFPAPFGPNNPKIWPDSKYRLKFCTAVVSELVFLQRLIILFFEYFLWSSLKRTIGVWKIDKYIGWKLSNDTELVIFANRITHQEKYFQKKSNVQKKTFWS